MKFSANVYHVSPIPNLFWLETSRMYVPFDDHDESKYLNSVYIYHVFIYTSFIDIKLLATSFSSLTYIVNTYKHLWLWYYLNKRTV